MASAIRTSNRGRSYADFIDRTKFPEVPHQRVPKQPGSKKLVCGEWVEVKPGDEDAVSDPVVQHGRRKKNGPAQSRSRGGTLGGGEGPALIGSRRLGGPSPTQPQN